MAVETYFCEVARRVFEKYLNGLGAKFAKGSHTSARFDAMDWFVEASVLLENAPKYCPRVSVGPLPELGFMERDKQVEVLHTLPEESPLRRYWFEWRYTNACEMVKAFEQLRDKIFRVYTEPFLFTPERLRVLVSARSKQINEEWTREIDAHNDSIHRRNAQSALKAHDYSTFIQETGEIPYERQTELERKKLDYAIRQLAKK
jgi:hypothetical protein